MKRLVTVIVVMAMLLVGAPWVIGNVAQDRVNRSLDALTQAASYLGIVERKYTQGWFRSEQVVTFEVLGGVTRAFGAPSRFTVRNEILHGPVLGLSGVGLARVNSTLVLDPKLQREIAARFGAAAPFEVSTRVGFLGGGTTTISSDGREIRNDDGVVISWDDLDLDVSWSANFDSLGVKGDWPRFEARNPRLQSSLRLTDLALDVDSARVQGHLYRTDADFSIAELTFASEGVAPTTLEELKLVVDSDDSGDFTSVATRTGTGRFHGGVLEQQGIELTAMHCDLAVRRLHTQTLAQIADAMADAYQRPAAVSAVPDHLLELLKHDPELVIDRIGFETKDGAAYLKGVIRLKGATGKDLQMGALSLLARLDADLRFEAAPKVLEGLPGGREGMRNAIDGGYAQLRGGNVVSHLEFHAGQLEINGKVQGIPGLGPPSPTEGAVSPE